MPTIADQLRAAAMTQRLNTRDTEAALSIAASFDRYGSITERQHSYAEAIIKRAEPQTQPERETVTVGNMAGVIAMFQKAAQKLKSPKIKLICAGREITLYRAGTSSTTPGFVQINNGMRYGEPGNVWFGRISPDGAFEPSSYTKSNDLVGALTELLTQLSNDPAGTAAAHGRLTGRCCFCHGKNMTDPRSLAVGYGKVCAGKFGVPWGKQKDHGVFQAEQVA